jgi:NitT/TauT family transport system permease protein
MASLDIASAFLPNRVVSRRALALLALVQALLLLVLWYGASPVVIPRPHEVLTALGELWRLHGLGRELWVSMSTSAEAIALSALLGLVLSYATVLPALRPVAGLVSKGRFLGLVGLTFTFTLAVGGGHPLKVALLTFGMLVFFVTSMSAVIAAIPRDRFDYARALGMSETRILLEVVILGTADEALELLRQNAAIGWTLLTMVEGIARAEGGVGALLLNQTKHFHLAQVLAIQMSILAVGILQDYVLGALRQMFCPYADLKRERR